MNERVRRHSLVLQGTRAAVGAARAWLKELGARHGLRAEPQYALDLCANELLANIVEHGLKNAAGEIRLELLLEPDAVALTIIDSGPPFDPLAYPDPLLPESLEATSAGGRGLFLVRRFADALHYERVDDRNRFTVRIAGTR